METHIMYGQDIKKNYSEFSNQLVVVTTALISLTHCALFVYF